MIPTRAAILSGDRNQLPKSLDPIESDRVTTAYACGPSMLHMKARQSNYWNKLTQYNHKLY